MATQTLGQLYESAIAEGRTNMEALCHSFPVLRNKPGTRPWDQYAFARWASGPAPSHASRQAAAFVLSVWNGGTPDDGGWWNEAPYSVGVFDPVDAIARWDHQQIAAFVKWCHSPFWP